MKMKKVVSMLLIGSMLLSLAACGNTLEQTDDTPDAATNDGDTDEPEDSSDGEKKTISILWPETDSTQVDVMENYVQPVLAEKFPDIEFEYVPMTADSPIRTLSASGDLPEIFYTGGPDVDAIVGAGDALDVAPYLGDGWVEENYSNPDLLYNGEHIYFLTPGQNAYYSPVFYYNKEIFDANGLEEPNNMEELVAACQTLKDAGLIPITTVAGDGYQMMLDGFISSVAPDAFIDLNNRDCDWTDERIKEALAYFDELKLMGAFTPDMVNKDGATSYAEFQAGEAVMILTFSWMNGDMTSDKTGFETGTFSFPNTGDDYIQLIYEPRKGNGGGYTGNANYEDPELLAEILKVIVEAESERHNANGVRTNFIVENPAEPANELEAERYADYERAAEQISVLFQGQMDGVTIAELQTLYNMLASDDQGYLSENFIEEFEPIWEANTYGPN